MEYQINFIGPVLGPVVIYYLKNFMNDYVYDYSSPNQPKLIKDISEPIFAKRKSHYDLLFIAIAIVIINYFKIDSLKGNAFVKHVTPQNAYFFLFCIVFILSIVLLKKYKILHINNYEKDVTLKNKFLETRIIEDNRIRCFRLPLHERLLTEDRSSESEIENSFNFAIVTLIIFVAITYYDLLNFISVNLLPLVIK